MNVFIWCEDATAAFERVRGLLASHSEPTFAAGFRDENADEYTPLWPPGRDRFDLSPDAGVKPLSIGAVLGDADAYNMAWKRQIMALSQQLEAVREDVRSPISVNVIFHVDGRLLPNDFEGLRKGRLRAKDAQFNVDAAVPKHAGADQPEILIDLLREAVSAAEKAGRKKGIAESLPELHSLVENLGNP